MARIKTLFYFAVLFFSLLLTTQASFAYLPKACLDSQDTNDPDKKIQLLEECKQNKNITDKEKATAYLKIGNVRMNKKDDLEGAIYAYDKATSLDPKLSEAYMQRARACKLKGKTEQSIVAYEKAISLDPTNTQYYINYAITCKENGKTPQFTESINKLKEIDTQKYFELITELQLLELGNNQQN